MKQEQPHIENIRYLKVLLASLLAIILSCLYAFCAPVNEPGFWKLFLDSIPSALIVLIASPIVYFLFYRKGLSESQDSTNEIAEEVASLVVNSLESKTKLLGYGNVGHDHQYTYIDGQNEAMEALRLATLRAKREIRSTRFFPLAIRANHPAYAEAIRSKVLGAHPHEAVDRYYRIVSANKREKLEDCIEYVTNFKGRPFILYLVGFSNDFELVIIDDDETFIHFYGDQKLIASTLHLRGSDVTARFRALFTRLHEPKQGRHVKKIDLKYVSTNALVQETIQEIEKFFDWQLELRQNRSIRIKSEHDETGQPATNPELDSEGSDKLQPEAEGRSR